MSDTNTPNNSESETKGDEVSEVVTDRRKIASKENIRKALAKRNELLKEKKRLKEELEKSKEESESDSDTEEIIYIHPRKGKKKYVKSETESNEVKEEPVKEEPVKEEPIKDRSLKRTVSEYPIESYPKVEVVNEKPRARYSVLF